ncbi:MAG: pyruvate formate lyase family protein [Thermodesulfobacteriota bacterium]|nr:pyruvate formate lyase family protein [Thermodesulfobacteriota bacterium]
MQEKGCKVLAAHDIDSGWVKPDGSDACNDMIIDLMQATRLVRVANPTFSFRLNLKVKEEVMRECFECIRQRLGYPSMRNDPFLIHNVMNWHGHSLGEARTWVPQACMFPCPTHHQAWFSALSYDLSNGKYLKT